MRRLVHVALATFIATLSACAEPPVPSEIGSGPCEPDFPPPDGPPSRLVHLKTSATVVSVRSPCTILVRIFGCCGALEVFAGKRIVLRATSRTIYATGHADGATRLGALGLKPGDEFTLSFDGRTFADGSYPLNYINVR